MFHQTAIKNLILTGISIKGSRSSILKTKNKPLKRVQKNYTKAK